MTSQSSQLTPEFFALITSNTSSPGLASQSQYQQSQQLEPTANHQYAVLTRCWRYERGCSLLLPYPSQFLDPIKRYIETIDGKLMDHAFPDDIQHSIHELEIERLRYIFNDVHRVRLRKIEQNALYYAFDKNGKTKLSPSELEFAKGYARLLSELMRKSLEPLPGKYGSEPVAYESPITDHVVLLHYLPEPEQSLQPKELDVPSQKRPLYPNSMVVVPYEECAEWVKNGEFDVL